MMCGFLLGPACPGMICSVTILQSLSCMRCPIQDPHALEDLTGLTELHSSAAALAMMDDSEDDEDDADVATAPAPDQAAAPAQPKAKAAEVQDDWLEL